MIEDRGSTQNIAPAGLGCGRRCQRFRIATRRAAITIGVSLLVVLWLLIGHMVAPFLSASGVPREIDFAAILAGLIAFATVLALIDHVLTGMHSEARLAEVLAHSERRFRSIMEQAADAFLIWDACGLVVDANPAACDSLGYSRPDLIGMPVSRLAVTGCCSADPCLEGDLPRNSESCRYRRKDGGTFPAETRLSLIDWGQGRLVLAVIRDISERVRSQAQLATLHRAIEQSGSAVIITDAAGRIDYVNRRFAEFARLPREELIGMPAHLLRPVAVPPRVCSALWQTVTRGREWSGEFRVGRDGEPRWVAASVSPVKAPDGTITNFVGIGEDITQQRQAQEKRWHDWKAECIGQLAGGVAHDFNNLLTIILGTLEMAEEMAVDRQPLAALVSSALRTARRGASLTERLLAMFHKRPVAIEAVDVNDSLQSVMEVLERTLPATITLTFSPCGGPPPVILADRAMLENAILNLALNARDAMPAGGGLAFRVQRGAQRRDGRPAVALSVGDTGCGMSQEVADRAFEPFFTTKPAGRGTGLGLNMVHDFVLKAGGEVTVDSRLDHGTTVTLLLPEARDLAPAPCEEKAVLAQASARVLVVEDADGVRDFSCQALRGLGYETTAAATAAEALAILEAAAGAVDLLFSDAVLPGGMSGPELAAAALGRWPAMAVVITSGQVDPSLFAAYGLDEAGVSFLPKPYDRRTLANSIGRALRR